MKYKLHTNKKHQKLIPGIGKRLTLLLFCLLNITLMRGQVTGSLYNYNTIINNDCDLNFCASINQTSFSGEVYLADSALGYYNCISEKYIIDLSTPQIGSKCAFKLEASLALSVGTHKIYLNYGNAIGVTKLDSITVNVVNPINALTYTTTVNPIPGATSGEQLISIGTLDPSQTYTLGFGIQDASLYIYDTTYVTGITGVSAFNYTFNPTHNGSYYIINPFISSSCRATYFDNSASSFTINSDPCDAVTSTHTWSLSAGNFCANDTVGLGFLDLNYYYSGLTPNSTGIVFFDFGDGTALQTQTVVLSITGEGYGALSIRDFHKVYQFPGAYTIKSWMSSVSACYVDTNISVINVMSTSCGSLRGMVYKDANSNCIQDGSEVGIYGVEIRLTQGTTVYYAWTDASGQYAFYNIPVGAYTIQIGNNTSGYSAVCSNSQAHGTTVNTTGTTIENFAVSCNSQFDIAVTGISLMDGFFPGQVDAILPHVGLLNYACTYQSIPGQVKIILDPCIKYDPVGGASQYGWFTPLPDAIVLAVTGDTLIWNVSDISNMGNFGYFNYPAAVTTCTNAQVGDTACITVMVLPSNGDADLTNNSFTRCFAIGVAYDPNFKEVSPKGAGTQGYINTNTPELRYTVHFQNTGTAPAHNIYVLDTLSNNLDINTLKVLSSSHSMQTYMLDNNTLKFMFANIMLPDSTHDEAHSHGYVTYTAKPKAGLSPGTQIKNTGYIYFDYNSPIVTNTTLNTIALVTGINELAHNGLVSIYPNPAKDKLVVSITKNENSVITVTDILGKEVIQQKAIGLQTELNVSDLQSGVYFVKVNGQTQKVVVAK